mgnify:CR=1 FL=1
MVSELLHGLRLFSHYFLSLCGLYFLSFELSRLLERPTLRQLCGKIKYNPRIFIQILLCLGFFELFCFTVREHIKYSTVDFFSRLNNIKTVVSKAK